MDFSYKAYKRLIHSLQRHGYIIADYHNWNKFDKCAILRHDIDTSIEKAVEIGKLEASLGVKSTFFVLLSSDFYNVMTKKSRDGLRELSDLGHELGLHFDETVYKFSNLDEFRVAIKNEAEILEKTLGTEISTVSMHRPSRETLELNLSIPGMVNSYSNTFFREFKYLSDSRMNWKEPVEDIIESEEYNHLHILTHAFWYDDIDSNIHDSIARNITYAKYERYSSFYHNISALDSVIDRNEIDRL